MAIVCVACILDAITSTNTEQHHEEARGERLAAKFRESGALESPEFRTWRASNAAQAVHDKRTPEERSARAREVAIARWVRVKQGLTGKNAAALKIAGRVSVPACLWDCLLVPAVPGEKPLLDTYLKMKLVFHVAYKLWRDIGSKAPPAWTEPIGNRELGEALGCTPQAVIQTVRYLVDRGILLDDKVGQRHRYALRVRNWRALRAEKG